MRIGGNWDSLLDGAGLCVDLRHFAGVLEAHVKLAAGVESNAVRTAVCRHREKFLLIACRDLRDAVVGWRGDPKTRAAIVVERDLVSRALLRVLVRIVD